MGLVSPTLGQVWTKDSISNVSSIDHLFFSRVRDVFVGADSKTFVITEHNPDSYWDKENIDKSVLLVSHIDNSNITVIKKLDYYAKYPKIKFYNNKYYIFDSDVKVRKKNYYYVCYVYNADWSYSQSIELNELPQQKGFYDFVVDKIGNLYFLSNPYYVNYKTKGFVGNYLIKISSIGQPIKKALFNNCIPIEINISNDSLNLTLIKQGIETHFLFNDSVINIEADTSLNYKVSKSEKYKPKDSQIAKEITLTNNKKVLFIDSLVKLSPISSTSIFKIGLNDIEGHRVWTKEPNNRWFYGELKALSNGDFITQVDKRWDSTTLVVFNQEGKERQIKAFLMNADTRIIRFKFLEFFEFRKNEIFLFYLKEFPTRKEVYTLKK